METQVFFPKDPAVKGFVELYLVAEALEPFELITIPNGRVDASIQLSGELEWLFKSKNKFEPLSQATFYPLTRDTGKVRSHGPVSCIGIKFFPHVLISPVFENKKLNEPVSFSDVFRQDAAIDPLIRDLKESVSLDHNVEILDTFLRKFFEQSSDDWIQQIVSVIESKSSMEVKISEIAQGMRVSIKTLERRFQKAMGITPKLFSTLIRLQQATRTIRKGSSIAHGDLSEALDAGYYDQPHFVRSCRKITGLSPKMLFNRLPDQVTDFAIVDKPAE